MIWGIVAIVGILSYTIIEVLKMNNETKYKIALVKSKNSSSEEKAIN